MASTSAMAATSDLLSFTWGKMRIYDKIVSMERDLKIHSIALSSLFVLPYFSLPRCRTRQLGIRVN